MDANMGHSPREADANAGDLSVTQRVLEELRTEIVTAQLAPGSVIREADVAARFRVSKTPVREALQRLLAEDFVMVFPRRGYMVKPVGITDLQNVMALRSYIEPPLAAIAAKRRSSEVLEQLEASLALQRDGSAELTDRLAAAPEFHRLIAAVARNERANGLLRTYFDETSRMHFLFPEAVEHITSETEFAAHREILDAIIAGDAERASAAMAEHLTESNEALLRSFY
ncbi:DNA-binding GntR family transcriptional regulator [Leucobacter luti]|uniref:GntR family transcriptional regulator n=1 Tax=Leucobacter luti TaxID=340320 RepID=UPI0010E970B4|nr:GntR family transcriptional regulator [Leucobacter luti]MCW2287112.1 DNA-binding GntR family transcriptional regulator [Leucobacter luti]TCK41337.1 DNA-binding GntR family transcriptional regulator [Leucobacter luti]